MCSQFCKLETHLRMFANAGHQIFHNVCKHACRGMNKHFLPWLEFQRHGSHSWKGPTLSHFLWEFLDLESPSDPAPQMVAPCSWYYDNPVFSAPSERIVQESGRGGCLCRFAGWTGGSACSSWSNDTIFSKFRPECFLRGGPTSWLPSDTPECTRLLCTMIFSQKLEIKQGQVVTKQHKSGHVWESDDCVLK